MERRDFLKLSPLGLTLPGSLLAEAAVDTRSKLKKNVVLVSSDFGLCAKFSRPGGADCKYVNEYFQSLRSDMTYFDGISEPGIGGGHSVQDATFTGVQYKNRHRHPDRSMISLDQYLADHSLQTTRNRLLYHKVTQGDRMSWNRFSQPMPAAVGLGEFHELVFGKVDVERQIAALRREQSVLNALAKNIRRGWRGTPEEQQLKASVEFQLMDFDERVKWLRVKKPHVPRAFDPEVEEAPLLSCRHNFEIVFQALRQQQTQIAVLQFGRGLTANVPGITKGHHSLTHSRSEAHLDQVEMIDGKVLAGLRDFLHKLRNANLLDDTIVLFHSGMADASKHTNQNGVALLFGGGFKHKKSVACRSGRKNVRYSTSMLFSSVIKQAGLNQITFNGNSKLVPGLFSG